MRGFFGDFDCCNFQEELVKWNCKPRRRMGGQYLLAEKGEDDEKSKQSRGEKDAVLGFGGVCGIDDLLPGL